MPIIAVIVSALSVIFAIVTFYINFNLINRIFVAKSLNKSNSLTLFYVRFVVDGLLGIQNAIISTSILIKFLNMESLSGFDSIIFLFWVSWSTMCFFNMRAVLVIVISLDRTLAVFLPITYHNFRRRLRNSYLALIPLCWPIVNNLVLWVYCQFEVNIPAGCVIFTCQMNKCYISYALSFEVVSHAIIALTSFLLAVKLFIWNHCKHGPKSKDLERANYLALIDTLIIILFDIVPAGVTVKFPNIAADYGSLILVCKMGGYALEGWLVRRALKRTNDMISVTNGRSSMVKSSGPTPHHHVTIRAFYIKKVQKVFKFNSVLCQICYRCGFCFGNLIMLFFAFLNLTKSPSLLDYFPVLIFYISWPTVTLMSIRAFLVIIITLDRTLAVFSPVSYHNYRSRVSNSVLIFVVIFGWTLVENTILWVVCNFVLLVPMGCIGMGCYMNKCYIQWFMSYELISHCIIAATTLILVFKIFVWNNCTNSSKSKDLTRANILALLDTFIIFFFDIIPAALLSKFPPTTLADTGPLLAVTKMGGYVIEGYLVVRALKRKLDMESESNAKSWSVVKVQPSGGPPG